MSDTYNPPGVSHGELPQIAYDFGYREAKLGNKFQSNDALATLEILIVNPSDAHTLSTFYRVGYSHGLNVRGYINFPQRTTRGAYENTSS